MNARSILYLFLSTPIHFSWQWKILIKCEIVSRIFRREFLHDVWLIHKKWGTQGTEAALCARYGGLFSLHKMFLLLSKRSTWNLEVVRPTLSILHTGSNFLSNTTNNTSLLAMKRRRDIPMKNTGNECRKPLKVSQVNVGKWPNLLSSTISNTWKCQIPNLMEIFDCENCPVRKQL